MTKSFSSLCINPDRMLAAFNQLALIGATSDGGVDRITFSETHLAARIHQMGRLREWCECFVTNGVEVGHLRVK